MEDERLLRHVVDHPYPLVFATISGAHLYGFPSPDSDYDLRGIGGSQSALFERVGQTAVHR